MSFHVFAWGTLAGASKRTHAGHPFELVDPITRPDFLGAGVLHKEPPEYGYDEFGWWYENGHLIHNQRALYALEDVAVLRKSRGIDRYHILLDDEVCALDSYHDGRWIGKNTGETMNLSVETPDGDTSLLPINIMDEIDDEGAHLEQAVLLSHLWCHNYAHTLIETPSRLWFFEEKPWACFGDMPIIWDITRPYQREIAHLFLGDLAANVIPLPANLTHFDRLYVPSFYTQIGSSRAAIQWLRKTYGPPSRPGKRRLYVSRESDETRKVLNEREVMTLVKAHGFDVVKTDRMTVAQQRELFGDAEAIAMPHGAAMANILFAPSGIRVIEMLGSVYQHNMYWHIAKWCDDWYGRIVCESRNWCSGRPPGHADMVVDLDHLKEALSAAGL